MNNTGSHFTNSYFSFHVHIILILFYVLVTIVSIIANVIVWVAIFRKRELRSPMNYLVLNLSLADLVTAISIYPYIFIIHVDSVTERKTVQDILCSFTEGMTLFFVAAGASLLTLCAISFNRYLAIMYPAKQNWRMGKRGAKYYNAFAWLSSTAFMTPGAITFSFDANTRSCGREWLGINETAYRITIWLVGTSFPLTFLFLSFGAIVVKSKQRAVFMREQAHTDQTRNVRFRKAEKMLGLLILVYIICWIPFSIYWGLITFSKLFPQNLDGIYRSSRWLRITVLFSASNGLINPFIYGLGSKELKTEIYSLFNNMFSCHMCKSHDYKIGPALSTRSRNTKDSDSNQANTLQHNTHTADN